MPRAVAILVAFCALASQALALDPSRALTQYGHTAWRVRDGSFPAPPAAIAQTSDGYLWIGSEAGLVRFDGVTFERWTGSPLPDERVVALLGTRDGSLWIGMSRGLAQLKDGKLIVHARMGRFTGLAEDRDGVVWAGHTRALSQLPPLCRFDRTGFHCFAKSATMPFAYVATLREDRSGTLWIGGDIGVCRLRLDGQTCHPLPALAGISDKVGVFQLTSEGGERVWAGAGATGLWHLESGSWKREPFATSEVTALITDRAGAVWIGTQGSGLFRRIAGRTEQFKHIDGLSSDNVLDLFEDSEGDLWIATSAGLDRLRNLKVATLTAAEGLGGGYVDSVTASRDGSVWVALVHALARVADEKITLFGPNDLQGSGPTTLLEDSSNRLLVGVDDGLRVFVGGRFVPITMPDGKPTGVVIAIAEDHEHDLWIATAPVTVAGPVLLRLRNDAVVETFSKERFGSNLAAIAPDPSGGLWLVNSVGDLLRYRDGVMRTKGKVPDVRNMFVDARGVWLATKHGLIRISDGKIHTLATHSGLPCDDIESVVADQRGSLWLKTGCGVVRLRSTQVEAWIAKNTRMQPEVLDTLDGAFAGLPPFSPRSTVSNDGRVWFATEVSGLQVIQPKQLQELAAPKEAKIVRVIADRKSYALPANLRFPPLTRDLEIDYTSLSLAFPEKVRFRYRLEGSEWLDVGTRREAYFNNLNPGTYRFQVMAGNESGAWNHEPANLEFSIVPAFHQTQAFVVLCLASIAALVLAIYYWRMHHVRAVLLRSFEERLDERTRIARELHDTLLQGFLSSSLQLQVAMETLPSDSPVLAPLERVRHLMRQVIDEGRASLRNLRASLSGLDDLEHSLSRVPSDMGIRSNAAFRVVVNGASRPLRAVARDEVYRIAREAVVNAHKHANAQSIEVELEFGVRELRVIVRDDGDGIVPDVLHIGRDGHWGLAGMRERAQTIGAELTVRSGDQRGTEVELVVPNAMAFESSDVARSH
jgi:signal transduction histidine kinase/ligand-binding sensor domain-containing protein